MSLREALLHVQRAVENYDGQDEEKHAILLGEIHKLQLAAEKPDESIMRLRWQFMATFAIRFAIEYGIVQTISAKLGEPVSAAELAQTSGAEELLIIRTMRLVTHDGVCDEVGHGIYAANDRTKFLTMPAILGGFTHVYDFGFKTVSMVPELIREQKLCQFPRSPEDRSPIQHVFGDTMFGVLSKDPRRKKIFDDYMEARRYSTEPKWFEIFPAGQKFAGELKAKSDEVQLVDVGGGKGHDIALFRQRFPDLAGRLILQDLPRTFSSLTEKPPGVELMEHDFFTEQPVKGARVYFLRSIMHDWADEECIKILGHIVAAMHPEKSRILIDDFVVPDTKVDWLTASLDMCMWLFFSGIERTMSQWQRLFDVVGLEVVDVWSTRLSRSNVVELQVRR
ncbi:hypothetical protein LTR85_000201 [Meristemomyces frigidus]|nr:hypothetical protein LTR85_000201 [Meristemomyces frigidus]